MTYIVYTLIWKEFNGFVVQLGTFITREDAEKQIQADIPNHDLDEEYIEEFIEDTYVIIESFVNKEAKIEIKNR
jgi:hypothetical protein